MTRMVLMSIRRIYLLIAIVVFYELMAVSSVQAQGFNIASTYPITDPDAVSGDILINGKEAGFVTSNVSYDAYVFGVLQENPIVVLRQTEPEANMKPVITTGDTPVNVNDYNGEIKKGDYVTTSPQKGKGMRAGDSGYVVGIALTDATYGNETISIDNKSIRSGTVEVSVRVEYAEIVSARNYNTFFTRLNEIFFKQIQNPERFTLIIRYLVAGLIGLIAFAVGFFAVTKSVSNATQAIGRNPLAKSSILISLGLQIGVAVVGSIVAIVVIFLILRG